MTSEIFNTPPSIPTSIEEARRHLVHLTDCPLNDSPKVYSFSFLSKLLSQALSPTCPHRTVYIERIMGMSDEVQRELMTILQGNSVESDVEETADYSTLESVLEEESDDELPDATEILNRSLIESAAAAASTVEMEREEEDDTSFLSVENTKHNPSEEEVKQLKATVSQLQTELTTTRQQEQTLLLQVDELKSTHKAEMIRLESQSLQSTRHLEEKYSSELLQLQRQNDQLVQSDKESTQLRDEMTRLRDELDVLHYSHEKLLVSEEQVRKLKTKLQEVGDVQSALEREEKAHSSSVEKCVLLEKELNTLKPLKRQLEEYKVRVTEGEVALMECKEDLRRLKEKSWGLEGMNMELRRGVEEQRVDCVNQRRLLEGDELATGGGVGCGMR
jgi:chromosome segregation ATPase